MKTRCASGFLSTPYHIIIVFMSIQLFDWSCAGLTRKTLFSRMSTAVVGRLQHPFKCRYGAKLYQWPASVVRVGNVPSTQSIPAIIGGRDVLGIAPTGSGKTAAFTLPILHSLKVRTIFGFRFSHSWSISIHWL